MPGALYAPRAAGVRDPRDPRKQNGFAWNWPRYLYLGGAPQRFSQSGAVPIRLEPMLGQNATGPISDRGRTR